MIFHQYMTLAETRLRIFVLKFKSREVVEPNSDNNFHRIPFSFVIYSEEIFSEV